MELPFESLAHIEVGAFNHSTRQTKLAWMELQIARSEREQKVEPRAFGALTEKQGNGRALPF